MFISSVSIPRRKNTLTKNIALNNRELVVEFIRIRLIQPPDDDGEDYEPVDV